MLKLYSALDKRRPLRVRVRLAVSAVVQWTDSEVDVASELVLAGGLRPETLRIRLQIVMIRLEGCKKARMVKAVGVGIRSFYSTKV